MKPISHIPVGYEDHAGFHIIESGSGMSNLNEWKRRAFRREIKTVAKVLACFATLALAMLWHLLMR